MPFSPELKRRLILSVGTHRSKRPLSPIEVAKAFAMAKAGGLSSTDIAEMAHLHGTTMIGRFQQLLRLSPKVRHLVDWGQTDSTISFSAAVQIARLNIEEQEALINAVLEHGLTKMELRQVVQIKQRSGKAITSCVEEILRLRPEIIRKYVFIGTVVNQRVASALAGLTQAERNTILEKILKDKFGSYTQMSGRLGEERFSLVGDNLLAEQLNNLEPNFEEVINGWLANEIESAEE